MVTASKRSADMMEAPVAIAVQEELGDLKLYRVPIPVTVAANAQKQVALLIKDDVPFRRIHRLNLSPDQTGDPIATELLLRMQNKEAEKLGVPLPSGKIAVFETVGGHELLAGEGDLRDHAVGETVNLVVGESSQVQVQIENYVAPKNRGDAYRATVTNANPFSVSVELGFYTDDDDTLDTRLRRLPRKDGLHTWHVTVPANDSRTIHYYVKAAR